MHFKSLAVAVGIAASGAHAADGVAQLDTVQVTAGRQASAAFESTGPLTVIDEGEMQARHPQVMTEALRFEPGAFFQQTGPGQGIVITRGLKGAEVLHLVDGMRLNNAFFRTAPSQYIALLDPQNIGQLELLRGPYATLYGSDAMGGVVQVLTPEERFEGDGWGWRQDYRLHYQSSDMARTARVQLAGGDGSFSIAGGFSFADYGTRKLSDPGQSPNGSGGFTLSERVNDTAYLSRGYDLKTLWTPVAGHELMVSAQYFTLPALPRYNETVPGFRASGLPATALSIYDNDRTFYHARYRHTAPLGFMDNFELHLGRQVISDDRIDRTQTLSRDTLEYNRSTLTGLTAQAQTQVAAHRLSYGVELYRDAVDSRSMREAPPGSGSFSTNSASGFQSRFPDGAEADDYGVYVMDNWTLAGDWTVDAGLRYSRHNTNLPKADRAFASELKDDDVTGNLGMRYLLRPGLAWTLNAGRGYRAPNINDLAQVGSRSGNRNVVANYDLRPESVRSVDTGFKFSGGGLQGEATLFYSDYQDRITLVSAFAEGAPECPDDGNAETTGCSQNQNIAKALYYGVEGGLRYAWTPALALRGVLNYTFGQQESGGTKTPGNRVPPLNGQVALEWTAAPGWLLRPQLVFADAQDRLDPADLSDARINPQGTPGYAVLNLRTRWQAHPDLSLQLDAINLLDKFYREHGSGIEGSARGLGVSAEMQFGS